MLAKVPFEVLLVSILKSLAMSQLKRALILRHCGVLEGVQGSFSLQSAFEKQPPAAAEAEFLALFPAACKDGKLARLSEPLTLQALSL